VYDRRGYCNKFKGNDIRGSVGDCGVIHERCKGQSDGFQKEMELFGGKRDGSRCGVAGQEAGNNEAVVGIIEGVNNDNFGDSGR
jgi:hypothetical protein